MLCAPVQRDNSRALAREAIDRTGAQTMLYLTCTTINSVDLAHYGVSRAKDWVSVDCGINSFVNLADVNFVDCFLGAFRFKFYYRHHDRTAALQGQGYYSYGRKQGDWSRMR